MDTLGKIEITNDGYLRVYNDILIQKDGGNKAIELNLIDSSVINCSNDIDIISSNGTTENLEISLIDKSIIHADNDLILTNSGGPKILFSLTDTTKLSVERDIIFSAHTPIRNLSDEVSPARGGQKIARDERSESLV